MKLDPAVSTAQHHSVGLENGRVRVLEYRVVPGAGRHCDVGLGPRPS